MEKKEQSYEEQLKQIDYDRIQEEIDDMRRERYMGGKRDDFCYECEKPFEECDC